MYHGISSGQINIHLHPVNREGSKKEIVSKRKRVPFNHFVSNNAAINLNLITTRPIISIAIIDFISRTTRLEKF